MYMYISIVASLTAQAALLEDVPQMLETLATRLGGKDGVKSRHAIDVVATARDMDHALKVCGAHHSYDCFC